MCQEVAIWELFNQLEINVNKMCLQDGVGVYYIDVLPEKVAQEKGKILEEFLIPCITLWVCGLEVKLQWNNSGNGGENVNKHLDQLFAVGVRLSRTVSQQTANLRKHLKRSIAKFRDFKESGP